MTPTGGGKGRGYVERGEGGLLGASRCGRRGRTGASRAERRADGEDDARVDPGDGGASFLEG